MACSFAMVNTNNL